VQVGTPLEHSWGTAALGATAGFCTMVANAASPVMAAYMVRANLDKNTFLGTISWFFLVINLTKVPISASLGLITLPHLAMNLLLVPAVVCGAWIGRRIVAQIHQLAFEIITLILSLAASALLLF
jgi:uncharacterized protein